MYPGYYRQDMTLWLRVGISPIGQPIFDGPHQLKARFSKSFVRYTDLVGTVGVLRNVVWVDTLTMRDIQTDVTQLDFMNTVTLEPITTASDFYWVSGSSEASTPPPEANIANTIEAMPDLEGTFRVWRFTV